MKTVGLILLLAALAGCRAETHSQADRQMLCSVDEPRRAFFIDRAGWDASFVVRTPSADGLCAR